MKYENYDPLFPDQKVVDLYLPIWANLPAFRNKAAFVWAEDGPAGSGTTSCSGLTYHQLNNSVQSISSQLLVPLQRGDSVVILCSPGLELVEILFACQRAGLRAIPLTPPNPSFAHDNHHHLTRVLAQTKPKAALAPQDYINRVKHYVTSSHSSSTKRFAELLQMLKWISIEEIKGVKADDQGNVSQYNGCKADDIYLIQYTSGATGIPKPVLVTAGAAAHNVRTARKAYDLHPNSVIVSWLPQYHDCGLMFLLLTIVSGATCVLTSPNMFVKRPRLWLELLSNYKATCTPVPSFALPLVIKRGGIDKGTCPVSLCTLKNLIIINEPIREASIQEFIKAFRPVGLDPSCISPSYGLAENCTFVSTAWRSGHDGNFPTYKKLVPSAQLSKSNNEDEEEIQILVVNEETHEPVADGVEGEIWISSPSNATGYLGHPSLTREVFSGRLKNTVAGCFVRTGDRGIVIGQERYMFVTGRCLDIIKFPDGQEIHPHYIEATAYSSCPDLLRGGCIVAFQVSTTIAVVAELHKTGTEKRLLEKVCEGIRKAVMEEEKVVVGLVVLVKSGGIPKTTSGKVQRWLAKDKLERGGMSIVMQMMFEDHAKFSNLFSTIIHADKERAERSKKGGSRVVPANARSHLPLLSSL